MRAAVVVFPFCRLIHRGDETKIPIVYLLMLLLALHLSQISSAFRIVQMRTLRCLRCLAAFVRFVPRSQLIFCPVIWIYIVYIYFIILMPIHNKYPTRLARPRCLISHVIQWMAVSRLKDGEQVKRIHFSLWTSIGIEYYTWVSAAALSVFVCVEKSVRCRFYRKYDIHTHNNTHVQHYALLFVFVQRNWYLSYNIHIEHLLCMLAPRLLCNVLSHYPQRFYRRMNNVFTSSISYSIDLFGSIHNNK